MTSPSDRSRRSHRRERTRSWSSSSPRHRGPGQAKLRAAPRVHDGGVLEAGPGDVEVVLLLVEGMGPDRQPFLVRAVIHHDGDGRPERSPVVGGLLVVQSRPNCLRGQGPSRGAASAYIPPVGTLRFFSRSYTFKTWWA